jgi:peptide deformylase
MVRTILRYGEPVLHRRAAAILAVDEPVVALVEDLIATMRASSGVGLAAPQVGVSQRVFVIDVSMGRRPDELLVLMNPEFEHRAGMQLEEEGCLSVPGFHATVARPAQVRVRALDRDGRPMTVEATGLLARAIQHEMDHLDGVLFIDRLRPIQRRHILRRVAKLRRRGRW